MEFINNILPGNYWLTKSMEFVKINSSGTLWYLKKWIVYYHYIFLKDSLYDRDYQEICRIFMNFIDSLDPTIQEDAKNFFFEVDIASNNFVKLNDFIRTSRGFNSDGEQRNFLLNAKKFYFTYIMNVGGQTGYKQFIKNTIISKKSYEKTIDILEQKLVEDNKIDQYTQLINDFHAVLRNERQIFFYYGFFHGKEASDLSGFYNLTNIGKTIIKANFFELLIIWEHQKIKMVSQSPVTDIQNLNKQSNINYSKFSTLNHPYVTFLHILNQKGSITMNQYQYIISKINNATNIESLINEILGNPVSEKACKDKAESFNRRSEIAVEDFGKELKKFILGIGKLPKDVNSNFFEFTSWINRAKITITNQQRADFILRNYKIFVEYLDKQNSVNYKNFEAELKKKYLKLIDGEDFKIDDSIKYEWYKYIINYDRNLYLNLIYISIALKEDNFSYNIPINTLNKYYEYYKFIMTSFGIKKKDYKNIIIDIQTKLRENTVYEIIEDTLNYIYIDPEIFRAEVNESNLLEISSQSTIENNLNTSLGRKRNISLVNLMRTFYIKNYANTDKLIKCDCCQSTTFLTDGNYPYLEFHHLIPFSTDFGPDHYLNLFGICPNCHRKLHFLNREERLQLYMNLSENNNMQKSLICRIEALFNNDALEPIHLDFLKKEKIITNTQYEELISSTT